MTTTQLFAELVVIGIGAALWLSLCLAAVFGYRFCGGLRPLDAGSFLAFLGVAYVLGIVVDRLAYELMRPIEKANWSAAIVDNVGFFPEALNVERYILVSSEALGKQVQYNRSRLRICRAWVLNSLLTLMAFVAWNLRLGVVRPMTCLLLVAMGVLICLLMGWATWAVSRDHYNNLRDSYVFLKGSNNKGQAS